MSKMLEEIREQPQALERTFREELGQIKALKKRIGGARPR